MTEPTAEYSFQKRVLFVSTQQGKSYEKLLVNNPHGTVVEVVDIETLRTTSKTTLCEVSHLVLAGELSEIKELILLAKEHDCSIGLLPLSSQSDLYKCFDIPKNKEQMVSLALRDDPEKIDLVYCNDRLLLYKGSLGTIPMIDSQASVSRLKLIFQGLKRMATLHLRPLIIVSEGETHSATTETAACGCIVLENLENSFASRLLSDEDPFSDGMVSVVIVAPMSVIEYLHLMWLRLYPAKVTKNRRSPLGYIRNNKVTVKTEKEMEISIDGVAETSTPATFEVQPGAVKLNCGEKRRIPKTEGKVKHAIQSLPAGKELHKARNKHIPFFTYASEDRFKDLFTTLRDDASLDMTFVVLMVISTMIATVGLSLDSPSVIIGAMLLAPLMAPIISAAMGLLRYDKNMLRESIYKILVGIGLAVGTSALFTLFSVYQPITAEMEGRLNPSVLDLIVAIVAGIGGAYTKSFKEIMQSLAGVAIAVALVPPLAVAGIGLGRGDLLFFINAFLLFTTNLIGIILAATFTFRILGFSPAVRDKRGFGVVVLFFFMICFPLTMASQEIVARAKIEKSWSHERFLVNGKYLIVHQAKLNRIGGHNLLIVDLHARDQLNRFDLQEFKRKVQINFDQDLEIRVRITYIP